MFKSVSVRAIVPVTVAVTGFVVVCCILLYSVMKADLIAGSVKYETNLANTIIKSARYAMVKSDRETLRIIIDNVGTQEGMEHVRIFNKKGLIMFSNNHGEVSRFVDKKTAGCVECHAGPVPAATLGAMKQARRFVNEHGGEVIAITAPIYNEPECSTADCHVHKATQKILGTLDIGLAASPLLRNLSIMRGRMVIFSIMILILTVGGVAALLKRTVFDPIRRLGEFTEEVARGNIGQGFPEGGGDIERLAANFRTMAAQLKSASEELRKLKGE
jgi:HAMP domain-containing protein